MGAISHTPCVFYGIHIIFFQHTFYLYSVVFIIYFWYIGPHIVILSQYLYYINLLYYIDKLLLNLMMKPNKLELNWIELKMDWMNTRMVDSIHESLISDALPFSDAILLVAKEGPTGLRLTRMVTTYPSCFLLPRENYRKYKHGAQVVGMSIYKCSILHTNTYTIQVFHEN